MDNKNVSLQPIAVKYGAILAAISIAIFLIGAISKNPEIGGFWLEVLILTGGILLAHREYKKKGDGFMSYGTGLGLGTLVTVVSSVISAVFSYIYTKFVNPDYLEEMKQLQIEAMEREGLSEEQMDMGLQIMEYFSQPELLAVIGILSTVFFGFILSLIVSAFTKKDNPELSV